MSDADSNRGRRYERGAIFLIGLGAAIPGVQYHLGPIGLAAAISIAGCLMLGLGHAHLLGGLRILPFDIVFAVYIVLRLCLELVNSQDLGHGFRYDTTVQLIIYFLSYLCLRLVIAGGMDRLEALSLIVRPAPFVALIGIAQLIFASTMQPVVGLLTGTSGVVARAGGLARATSTVGHWTGLGAYLLVALAVMCVLLSEKHARSRRTAVLSLVVILAGIVSTLTLAILIGATLLVILTFVQSSRLRHRLVPIALGGLLAAPLLAAPLLARLRQQFGSNPGAYAQSSGLIPESIAYRWEIWQNQTLPLIAERPLVGWGQGFYIELGTWPIFPYFVTWRSAESQYLLELVEGGLLQLAAFTGVLFTIALMFGWMSQGERKIIAMCFVTAVAAAFTVPIFTNVGLIGLLLPVLGVLLIGREHRSGAAGAKSRDVKWALS